MCRNMKQQILTTVFFNVQAFGDPLVREDCLVHPDWMAEMEFRESLGWMESPAGQVSFQYTNCFLPGNG